MADTMRTIHDDYAYSLLGHFVAAWGYEPHELQMAPRGRLRQLMARQKQDLLDMSAVWALKARDVYGLPSKNSRRLLTDVGMNGNFRAKGQPTQRCCALERGRQWLQRNGGEEKLRGVPTEPVVTDELRRVWQEAMEETGRKVLALHVANKRTGLDYRWLCDRANEMEER